MTSTPETLATTIGRRVRSSRRSRGWTLDQLAHEAGVSRRMLVNVEQGSSNPSVGTLLRIGEALGVGLPALVEPEEAGEVVVVRAGDGAVLWSGEHGGRGVLVAGTGGPDVLELWDWVLRPGDEHVSEAHSRGTRELVHVLEGTLLLGAGGATHTLRAGDAVSFPGDLVHSYADPDPATDTRFSLAVLEPAAGSTRRQETTRA